MDPILLDGPVGTELARRGVPTPLPLWTAAAIEDAPEVLAEIHRDYAAAGATVHTADTFRTDPYSLRHDPDPGRWERLTEAAVRIARAAAGGGRVAGSIAPLEDCYRPDLSPPEAVCREAHGRMARRLADAGADLLLCETFPQVREGLIALEAALETGLPAWLSFTPGPSGDLLDARELLAGAERAARLGAEVVLINCGRPERIAELLPALARVGVPFGAYGNVGAPDAEQGWRNPPRDRPRAYAEQALRWVELGARVVGGCCGTTPAHIAALRDRLDGLSGIDRPRAPR